ncbi:uncharacterized protein HD556DRAFT_1448612 [Suillus plorans]|uniref:Uncharacterized protein n=1 Tax=Suillus plorans TaxID=116603 RepID=A0A9P7AE72_9AGAM|nr:uncharacterized protein HD556DRAFT_1448612 [Suillus plorans]KAG1787602.1 hypothetical protein HD556DRAFT_1448612 [Suillus plorans]
MSSVIFNPFMLTVSPSPSPKPEECPLKGGNTSVDNTTFHDVAPKEPEESKSDRIECTWATMLNTMHVCVETVPPSKPELLEEQESWLRNWNITMANMTAVFELAHAASLHVSLNNVDTKEKVEASAVTACTENGKVKETAPTKEAMEKAIENASLSNQVGDAKAASRHERHAHSVIAEKKKGRTPSAPKHKVPSSTQTTAPDTGESEVEVVGEIPVNEPMAAPAKEIFMQWPKHLLTSDAAPAAKLSHLDANPELEEAHTETVWLCAENAELHAHNNRYRVALADICQHSCTQESELLHMSNQLYTFVCDWGTWKKELGEILDE